MPSEWREVPLRELCDDDAGIQTGPFGSQLHSSDYVMRGTPIITVEHLGENRIVHRDLPLVSDADRKRLSRYALRRGDIVFSRVGSVDRRALVHAEEEGWLFSGRCLRVRPKSAVADAVWLSYYFGLPSFTEYIRSIAVGATMPSLNTKLLGDSPIRTPSLPVQHSIARVLGALDDKIELNRKMNETLEQMARAIFKSWFVDFEPFRDKGMVDSPLGRIPKGWRVDTLERHVQVEKGLSYKGEGLADVGLPLHNLNSVYEGGGYKYEGLKHYTGEYRDRHIVKAGDLIVTNTEQGFDYLLIGFPAIVPHCYGDDGLFTHHLYRVRPLPGSPVTPRFLHFLLMSHDVREQVIGCTNGTTVNMLAADGLRRPEFPMPPADLVDRFDSLAAPTFGLMEQSVVQSRTLAAIRDALLPKLMSGEAMMNESSCSAN